MYGKVVALVVILAAVAMANPEPEPVAKPEPNPGYYTPYGKYVPTNEDFLNPRSPYYNPALVYDPAVYHPGYYPVYHPVQHPAYYAPY